MREVIRTDRGREATGKGGDHFLLLILSEPQQMELEIIFDDSAVWNPFMVATHLRFLFFTSSLSKMGNQHVCTSCRFAP